MTEEGPPPPKRVKLNRGDLESMTKEEILEKWQERETFLDSLVSKQSNHVGEKDEEQEKVKQQQIEATRRENVLVMRLTTKEQEMQEYMNQIAELKQAQNTSTAQLRSMLLDPAINLMFQRMKKEMDACKEKLEQAQNDLAAWKFTPDSQTGKRLMAKCRMLLQENEELGKIISSGRTAKLEGEIALEKTLVAEMKKSRAEMDEFLLELDEDVEGMQSTIYFLQQQLKESKEQLGRLQTENEQLKSKCSALANNPAATTNASPHASSTPTINSTSSNSSSAVTEDGSPEISGMGGVGTRHSPMLHAPQTAAVLSDDAKRTAPSPAAAAAAASHTAPTQPGGGTRTQTGSPPELPPSSMPSEEDKAPSRQLVSNHSLSQNHMSLTSNSAAAATAAAACASSAPGLVQQPNESLSSTSSPTSNSQPHHLQTSKSGATNGAHRPNNTAPSANDEDVEMAAAGTDLGALDGPSPSNNNKQTGNHSSSDLDEEDDEVASQSESPSQTPHYHHNHPHLQVRHQHPHHQQQKDYKHGPPSAGGGGGGRVPPSSTDGAPYGTDNTDDHSSVGWSPSGSKHSGSVGGPGDDGEGSFSSPSEEADATSTDAKSSANELLHNGLQSGSRGGTPGYDSQGDDET